MSIVLCSSSSSSNPTGVGGASCIAVSDDISEVDKGLGEEGVSEDEGGGVVVGLAEGAGG